MRNEGGVTNRRHDLAVLQFATSNCGSERGGEGEREGVVVHIGAGGLIMGGMEECTLKGREGGRKGGGHLALHYSRKISGVSQLEAG